MLQQFIQWGEQQALVRAMLLTSTRAIPGAVPDPLSDYDIILVMRDIMPYHKNRGWLSAFGRVLAVYHDPLITEYGFQKTGYVTQYEDGLKIDFTLWPVEILGKVLMLPALPDELDAGYQVLLDKDRMTERMKPPTYQAYIPKPPSEARYREVLESFFLDAVYVAKYLWRDDVLAAKHVLDTFMKHEHLLPVLEWHLEIEHGWKVKPGPYMRGLKKWLRPDLWSALERTYTGPGLEESWAALDEIIALMHKAGSEVGEKLGYAYPLEMEQKTVELVREIQIG